MAKRANPYTEDFVPQSKVHVGIKQFNNNEARLKKVHQNTIELLFKGAKNSHVQNVVKSLYDNSRNTKDKNSCMKQMVIGKDGALCFSDSTSHKEELPVTECRECSGSAEGDCTYCEVPICERCALICDRCDRDYCSQCIVSLYDESSIICLSCY